MENQAPDIKTLSRQLKLAAVQCRIEVVRHQIDQCQPGNHESRQLFNKLLSLVRLRNRMHTAADVLRIERERGLA